MRRTCVVALAGMALVAFGSGCAPKATATTPKLEADIDQLKHDIDTLPAFPVPLPESGSLWTVGGPGAALVRDTSAFRVNDLLTIRLQESSAGTNQAETDLSRVSEATVGADPAFGLESANPMKGEFNLNQVLDASFDTAFVGDGTTSRGNTLSATITARVMRVLPNGDMVVGGQKTVMVNRERQVLTLVGSVRPVDLDRDNEVSSGKVGELTVRLWGQGEIDDTVRQGWFMRILNRVWPF